MAACEKCWDAAFFRAQVAGGSQAEWYQRLLDWHKGSDPHSTSAAEGGVA